MIAFFKGGRGGEGEKDALLLRRRKGGGIEGSKSCFLISPLDDSVAAEVFRKVGFKTQQ